MTVLCNISPYIKCYALESCLKLFSLIERCSRAAYLFKTPFANHGLIFLLELLNNVIQYQYEGNTMLVYSVLRHQHIFKQLTDLKLPDRYAQNEATEASADAADSSKDA